MREPVRWLSLLVILITPCSRSARSARCSPRCCNDQPETAEHQPCRRSIITVITSDDRDRRRHHDVALGTARAAGPAALEHPLPRGRRRCCVSPSDGARLPMVALDILTVGWIASERLNNDRYDGRFAWRLRAAGSRTIACCTASTSPTSAATVTGCVPIRTDFVIGLPVQCVLGFDTIRLLECLSSAPVSLGGKEYAA